MSEGRIIPSPAAQDLPTYTILVDGSEIPLEYSVTRIEICKEINKISWARIVIEDGDPAKEDFEVSNTPDFVPGGEVTIKKGYHREEEQVFVGIITRHSLKIRKDMAAQLIVECRDVATKLTVGNKNKYFFEVTDAEAIEEVVGAHGIGVEVGATEAVHPVMIQFDATDWDFVVGRADANGLVVLPDDGTLKFFAPELDPGGVVSVLYGETIIEFDGHIDTRYQFEAVRAMGWDFKEQAVLEVEGSAPGELASGNLSPGELAGNLGLEAFDLHHNGTYSDVELTARASWHLTKSRLAKVCGKVSFTGFANIRPGDSIKLMGVGERFNGAVFVRKVQQSFKRGAWITEVFFGLPFEWFLRDRKPENGLAAGMLPGIHGLQTAVVKQVHEDPEGEDRIKVVSPTIDADAEGFWARMISVDAGDMRGVFFRPEVDDEVILGFLHGDPRQAIVLGCVHSSAKPAPIKPDPDNIEKGIISREDTRIIFNDEDIKITISTPAGNEIVLDESGKTITITDENQNTIVLDQAGITMESIKDVLIKATGKFIVEAMAIEMKAQTEAKIEGITTELNGSATTTIVGGLVKIN